MSDPLQKFEHDFGCAGRFELRGGLKVASIAFLWWRPGSEKRGVQETLHGVEKLDWLNGINEDGMVIVVAFGGPNCPPGDLNPYLMDKEVDGVELSSRICDMIPGSWDRVEGRLTRAKWYTWRPMAWMADVKLLKDIGHVCRFF